MLPASSATASAVLPRLSLRSTCAPCWSRTLREPSVSNRATQGDREGGKSVSGLRHVEIARGGDQMERGLAFCVGLIHVEAVAREEGNVLHIPVVTRSPDRSELQEGQQEVQ